MDFCIIREVLLLMLEKKKKKTQRGEYDPGIFLSYANALENETVTRDWRPDRQTESADRGRGRRHFGNLPEKGIISEQCFADTRKTS